MRQPNLLILCISILIAVATIAATLHPRPAFKNLQLLPADISEHRLDSIMNSWNKALHVDCEFCHIPVKDVTGLNTNHDFANDNNMKEYARKMLRMTMNINRQNFTTDSTKHAAYLNTVSCNTCHRGNPYPAHE